MDKESLRQDIKEQEIIELSSDSEIKLPEPKKCPSCRKTPITGQHIYY